MAGGTHIPSQLQEVPEDKTSEQQWGVIPATTGAYEGGRGAVSLPHGLAKVGKPRGREATRPKVVTSRRCDVTTLRARVRLWMHQGG